MDGLDELETAVDDELTDDAELVVDGFVTELSEGLLGGDDALGVVFDGIDDVVIGHTALHDVVLLPDVLVGTAGHHVV